MRELLHLLYRLIDIPTRISRRLSGRRADYRAFLFEDLKRRLAGRRPEAILEIGPRDGADTRRLLALDPGRIAVVDLPDKEEWVRNWMADIADPRIALSVGNIMYADFVADLGRFDVVWCTGVLYHNPEQLRMIALLHDLLAPGGILVIESATARRGFLRDENCVEIWHGEGKPRHRRAHVSVNVTHLPSRRAIRSWLEMTGFEAVEQSSALRRVSLALGDDRAAFLAARPLQDSAGGYYRHVGLDYRIGRSS